MAENKEVAIQYYIPENFLTEGRIFQGRIIVRNLIEGVLLALIFSLTGIIVVLAFPEMKLEFKVTIIAILAVPPLAIGIVGFNGDSISKALKSASAWMKHRDTMLYNTTPKRLIIDPLMTVISETSARDQILENIEEKRQENIRKKTELNLSEGKDFIFAADEHVDNYTKRKRKSVAESKGKKQSEKEFLIVTQGKGTGKGAKYTPDQELEFDDDDDFMMQDFGSVQLTDFNSGKKGK